jgi:molecular chaperone DnaK
MMREAEQHAEEDRQRKEAAETRNSAEQLVYSTENFIRDNQERIPADVRSEVETAVADLKEKLKGEDVPTIRSAGERLARVSQKLGQAIYAQASGGTGTGTATPPPGGRPEDEVVDAEIVDEEKDGKSGGTP